jgi:hypothetical protein
MLFAVQATPIADVDVDLCPVLVESYAVNERMNQIVLERGSSR